MNVEGIVKRLFYKTIGKKPYHPDLSVLEHLKSKDVNYLTNAAALETDLLPVMGLNNDMLHEMPPELYRFCGRGIYSWQYPNQFSKYLVMLSGFRIDTYLEIGVRRGGTFLVTIEYLKRFHPLRYAVGIDIEACPALIKYGQDNPEANFMLLDTQSRPFKEFINTQCAFDLVLIDGDHGEAACQNDFDAVKEKAHICVLHDIASDSAIGPGRVWKRIRSEYSDEYNFFEYTDQYASVRRKTHKSYLGIGVAVKKSFADKKGIRVKPYFNG